MNATSVANSVSAELTGFLLSDPDIEAAALYGSVARGDSETHSDIDLLLLISGSKKRALYDSLFATLTRRYRRLSLSIYTVGELGFLRAARSLFLLHLSQESLVLFDRTGRFRSLLRDFQPKTSYHEDFLKSLKLVDPLRTTVIGAPNHFHRLSYVYSLFRVFGVYLLAEKKIYEFSKPKMVRSLCINYPELSASIESLAELRTLNANFFSGGGAQFSIRSGDTAATLAEYLPKLGTLFGSALLSEKRTYQEAITEFRKEAEFERGGLGYRTRVWFLLLVYDGLNLYLGRKNLPAIRSFEMASLQGLDTDMFPPAIRRAGREATEYIQNYPLKYFLLEDSRIPIKRAQTILLELAEIA
jgi:predicted nucleotidyltransferase